MTPEGRLPYPGLRAYKRDETDLFFGREGCVNEMVDRLAATRFLAVLGTSGSGKSSLVRTGLLDALDLGLYAAAGSRWKVADCHPGENPLGKLARALLETKGDDPSEEDVVTLEAFLARGPLAIVEWLNDGNLGENENLLILVDQFEELFRYGDYAGREHAEAFVALLLESAAQHHRIHVVITMRSEYLGACALIPGLAEQINAGLYLARRMTREECRQAIVGPAAVVGFDIEPALVTRLLNDLSGFAPWDSDREGSQLQRLSRQADQLPLMQHVLSRLWQLAARRNPREGLQLTLQDYLDIGELRGALEQHADEIIGGISESSRPFVKPLFSALVVGANLADAVRRPRPFGELVAITGATREQVVEIVDAFRSPGCNFLRPGLEQELNDRTIVDISHESLIRQWSSLAAWCAEEADNAAQWARLKSTEARHAKGLEDLLSGLTLANTAAWWDREKPTKAWADSHGGNFEEISAFLARSREAQELEEREKEERARALLERQSLRRRSTVYAISAMVALAAAVYGIYSSVQADNARASALAAAEAADEQRAIAEKERQAADEQRALAEAARQAADEQRALAIESAAEAEEARRLAEISLQDANEQRKLARESQSRALSSISQLELGLDRPSNALKLAMAAWPRAYDPDGPQLWTTVDSLSKALPEYIDSVWFGGALPDGEERESFAGAFSPDGKWVATATWDSTVRIWDVETGEEINVLVGHEGPINGIVYSPDGSRIATSSGDYYWSSSNSGDQTARLWDATSGAEIAVLRGHEGHIRSIEFSPDGSRVLTASNDNTARIWDAADGREIRTLTGHSDTVSRAVFSPDGNKVATSGFDGTARVWDANTGRETAKAVPEGEFLYLYDVAFSPDGQWFAASGDDGIVYVWEAEGAEQVAALEHGNDVNALEFSPDGKLLAGASDNGLHVWNTETWGARKFDENTLVLWASFSPDGKHVLTRGYEDNDATIWNAQTGEQVALFAEHAFVRDADYSPNGSLVLTASQDGRARLWDAASGTLLHVLSPDEFMVPGEGSESSPETRSMAEVIGRVVTRIAVTEGEDVYSVAFSRDGQSLITAAWDGKLRWWDAESGDPREQTIEVPGSIFYAALSPDGSTIAAATSEAVLMFVDSQTAEIDREIDLDSPARMVDFSSDGLQLVTAHENGSVKLWNLESGTEGRALPKQPAAVNSARFSADGSRLVTAADDGSIRILDTLNGLELAQMWVAGDEASKDKVYWADFAHDGRFVAAATEKNGVQIWNEATRQKVATLTGTEQFSNRYVGFSEDGSRLITGGSNGALNLWDAATFAKLARLESPGPDETIWSVSLSPDGFRVAAGTTKGTVLVLDTSAMIVMTKGDAFAIACRYLESDTSLADAEVRYSLGELRPICGDNAPLPADPAAFR
ncbi:MAG: WD40 repeat domain-containing protein [Rhizobiaceae bacterium]|nr:WD40 repeat domain-containing protein [Rhizobiaceae bacterium]